VHELAICQALMTQVEQLAEENAARAVDHILVEAGPLSGVEPPLLHRAFEIARAGTVASAAQLEIRSGPVRVSCRTCGAESEAAANRLLCADCDDWQVNVTAGEELMLISVELSQMGGFKNV